MTPKTNTFLACAAGENKHFELTTDLVLWPVSLGGVKQRHRAAIIIPIAFRRKDLAPTVTLNDLLLE